MFSGYFANDLGADADPHRKQGIVCFSCSPQRVFCFEFDDEAHNLLRYARSAAASPCFLDRGQHLNRFVQLCNVGRDAVRWFF